jgi:hypothetical protein
MFVLLIQTRIAVFVQVKCSFSLVPVKNYEVPNMSIMTHSFVLLLQRDKEHPMHN